MVYFIGWKMHGFSHLISHSIRKMSKTHRMGKAWEISSHIFSIKWVFFFSIRFPSCGILHHLGNAWIFSASFHSMGKERKTYQMRKAWEIGSRENPTKPIVCGEPGKLVLILGAFFPLESHPMVYFIIREIYRFPHQFPKA